MTGDKTKRKTLIILLAVGIGVIGSAILVLTGVGIFLCKKVSWNIAYEF